MRVPHGSGLRARALVFALALLGCSGKPLSPRLVLLYMPCTVNRSFLAPYEPSVAYTPNFARIAREGVVFERHQSEAGQSGVAFASILSGAQATRHGVFRHPTPISDGVVLIAEAFAAAGFETWFWADQVMASPDLGYGRGVPAANTLWQPRPVSQRVPEGFLKGRDPSFRKLLRRLANQPDARAFVMTNFTVTHGAYKRKYLPAFCRSFPDACAGFSDAELSHYVDLYHRHIFGWMLDPNGKANSLGMDAAEVRRFADAIALLYAANVHRLDTLFGDVLAEIEAAGLLDETLIAVTSDHGETLYRPNAPYAFTHGFALAPEVLQVPWLLRGPDIEPRRYAGVTRSIDVFPTLAGLARVPLSEPKPDGFDLSRVLRGGAHAPALVAFSHTALFPNDRAVGPMRNHLEPSQMWVAAQAGGRVYKLVSDGAEGRERTVVYDWGSDPSEERDLHDPNDPLQRDFEARLRSYKQALVDAFHRRARASPKELPLEEQERLLRSLGYLE